MTTAHLVEQESAAMGILITAVRVGAEEERGLDAAELGEAAYVLDAPAPAVRPSAAPAGG